MDSFDPNKLTIFTEPACLFSHQVRLVLHEKDIDVDVIQQPAFLWPEDVLTSNPYGKGPTLVTRDVTLYHAQVITDYIEERHPHPRLFSTDPITRAKQRLMRHRIEYDWYPVIDELQDLSTKQSKARLKQLVDELSTLSPLFEATKYCAYDTFTMIDCVLAPLLWQLSQIDAKLPPSATAINDYQNRIFNRRCFLNSLESTN